VRLRAGNSELAISPRCGGVFTRWMVAGTHILRPCTPGVRDPLDSACFVLAPFSNFIGGGGFSFAGKFYPQRQNHPLEPEPIHGDAWLATWEVEKIAAGMATLSYEHSARQGFPFRYRVIQQVRLTPTKLTVQLRLTNLDRAAMPAGLGLHPYFSRPDGAALLAPHRGRWTADGQIPDQRFCRREEISPPLDVCYSGWAGTAHLFWPRSRTHIAIAASSSAYALVAYCPRSSDFVCIEPVTNVNDAFNAAVRGAGRTGVRVLEPGRSMGLKVRISVSRRPAHAR
jgi:aldose 1-epimerase